jgi:subtilisin family serine protease
MSLYLVRPHKTLTSRALGLMSIDFAPESRHRQVAELVGTRREDPTYAELNRWLREAPVNYNRETEAPITGTKVVEMTEEEAARLRREVPNVLVMPDIPLGLIEPVTLAGSAKPDLAPDDLWHLRAIGLAAARQQGFTGTGRGVTVAVLDTGIEAAHPELGGRVAGAVTFRPVSGEVQSQGISRDTHGHGTHVAGLICGRRVGVAPDVHILSGVMIPHAQGMASDFVHAIDWAGQEPGVSIVNISAGLQGFHVEMLMPVADLLSAGVLPVVAIGNEGRNKTRSPGNFVEGISVGATNRQSEVAAFSGGGVVVADGQQYTVPDLVAPGDGIFSCVMQGGYDAKSGTSMATPLVSGLAALVLEKFPQIRVPDLTELLLASCRDLGFPVDRQGQGLIQMPNLP